MADVMDGVQEREQAERDRQIQNARSRCAAVSAFICEECAEPIPEERRAAVAGVTHCFACQDIAELKARHYKGAI